MNSKVDELERLMRRTDASDESSYDTESASRDILAQGAYMMDAWTQALEDRDCQDAANVEVDNDIKDQ